MADYRNFSFGLYEKALPSGLNWSERFSCAKNAGYDFIEISIDESDEKLQRLDWNYEQKKKFKNDIEVSGLFIPTMCLSGHRRYPIGSAFSAVREKGMEIMAKAIDFASEMGIRIIQIAGYDAWYNEPSTSETANNYFENLRASVVLASQKGVMLAIENMGVAFMDSVEKAMELISRNNSPYLQAYPDIGNSSAMGKNIEKEFISARGHIVAVHIKDTKPGIVRRVGFGDGTVDFIRSFIALKDSGFTGPVVIEMWADEQQDTLADVIYAKQFVIKKMEAAWNSTRNHS